MSSSNASTSALFTPLKIGDIEVQHRLALAPLTRFRADSKHVHTDLGVEYYRQRSTTPGTLLITEATFISAKAGGYPNVPGVYTDDQIKAWKKVVDAVHAQGSFIYLQLWALGRAAKGDVLKNEEGGPYDVVSASDIPLEDGETPRPLTKEEIKQYVKDYVQAAKNFVEGAGGDGVEIHSANGYIIDQFLQTNSNKRTDEYGGSAENRVRFGLEVVDAVVEAVGAKKTGIRLSPYSPFQGMKMEPQDIAETFGLYVKKIKQNHPDLAYVHAVEGRVAGNADVGDKEEESLDFIHNAWTPNVFLDAGGFTPEKAYETAEHRKNTVIVFGRRWISTPDLPERIKTGIPLADYDRSTFYMGPGADPAKGYIDYPTATEVKARA